MVEVSTGPKELQQVEMPEAVMKLSRYGITVEKGDDATKRS